MGRNVGNSFIANSNLVGNTFIASSHTAVVLLRGGRGACKQQPAAEQH
jgi:hypothetical protein